jgi:hypothetical protein
MDIKSTCIVYASKERELAYKLKHSCEINNVELAKQLIKLGARISHKHLEQAVEDGYLDIVKLLITNRSDLVLYHSISISILNNKKDITNYIISFIKEKRGVANLLDFVKNYFCQGNVHPWLYLLHNYCNIKSDEYKYNSVLDTSVTEMVKLYIENSDYYKYYVQPKTHMALILGLLEIGLSKSYLHKLMDSKRIRELLLYLDNHKKNTNTHLHNILPNELITIVTSYNL